MEVSGLVITQVEGVTVAALKRSSILDGKDIDDIGAVLYDLVEKKDCRKLVVDFGTVTFLASQMIGVLIALDNKVRAIKGKVVLCGLRPELKKVFHIMRLEKRLLFSENEADALRLVV
jgi:anti-anti-sigma factor